MSFGGQRRKNGFVNHTEQEVGEVNVTFSLHKPHPSGLSAGREGHVI
jgi:hypothetical protein